VGVCGADTTPVSLHVTWDAITGYDGATVELAVIHASDGVLVALLRATIVRGLAIFDAPPFLEQCQGYVLDLFIDGASPSSVCTLGEPAQRVEAVTDGTALVLVGAVYGVGAPAGDACACFPIAGDVDGNGCVDAADGCALAAMLVGDLDPDPRADVNFDGSVDGGDISALVALVAGGPVCGGCAGRTCP